VVDTVAEEEGVVLEELMEMEILPFIQEWMVPLAGMEVLELVELMVIMGPMELMDWYG
jgi:hypothetical protein